MFRDRIELCRYIKQRILPLLTISAGSGNSGRVGVTCNVGALKHSSLKPTQATEGEFRRGIERWENEGGRLFTRLECDPKRGNYLARPRFLLDKRTEA